MKHAAYSQTHALMQPPTKIRAKIQALLLATLLLALFPALTACNGPHDGIYDDTAALTGADMCAVTTFIGKLNATNQYEFNVKSITGARTVWHHTVREGREGGEITIHSLLNETGGGDIKLVLIAPDGAITTLAEASDTKTEASHTFATQPGEYRVKVVGRAGAQGGASILLDEAAGTFGS